MRGDERTPFERCLRARTSSVEGADPEALGAEAARLTGLLADPAH